MIRVFKINGQPFPLFGYVGGLLGGLRFLDGADKLSPVIPGILRDGPEHIGYPVSYTHLDVYKRQAQHDRNGNYNLL